MLLQVPILYDKQTETIVSNESADIIRMFATECQVTIIHLLPCCSSWPSSKERQVHQELSLCTPMSFSCLAAQSQLAPRGTLQRISGYACHHAVRIFSCLVWSYGRPLFWFRVDLRATMLLLQSRPSPATCHRATITVTNCPVTT